MNTQVDEEVIEIIRMNPTMKKHLELEIDCFKMLQEMKES